MPPAYQPPDPSEIIVSTLPPANAGSPAFGAPVAGSVSVAWPVLSLIFVNAPPITSSLPHGVTAFTGPFGTHESGISLGSAVVAAGVEPAETRANPQAIQTAAARTPAA